MELKIYDKQGLVKMTVSPDNSSQWNHEVGVENVVTVNFTTWEFLVLEVGWYILVENQKFSIKSEYRPKHIHNTKYTYNLKFYGREHDAQDILFCRLNQGEDDLESVFAYDGTPMDFLQKVVANMNRNTDGVEWKAGEAISANRQTINFNGLYCWDALGEIARAFGTEWWMDGEYVNLSKCIRGESVSLGYGEGLKSGLTQNENTNAVKWFTRLIPVGSSKNIDKNKYGYANLQLPGREKYIDINTQYGLKEYREEAAFSEIYPHRVGTISSVRSETRTNEETGEYTVFFVKDSSLPFNPDEYMIGGEIIHMTFNNGSLAGKDFEVNWNNETKEFEIINQYPDDNTQLPGGNLVPNADDEYVLWNISMPDEYIRAAEQEYKEAVDAYLAEYSKDISIYSGNTDYIYIDENNVPLLLGQRVRLISEQYFDEGSRESRITRVSRKLNNLGEASIDCSDAIGYSWVSKIQSSVNSTIINQVNLQGKTEAIEKEVSSLSDNSKFWELRESQNGFRFLFSKLPVVTQYGITMYSDGGELNLPSIYAGIPFDNKTIWLNPDTGKVEVIGGTGGGVADSVHWNNIEGKPSFASVATSGKYSDLSGLPDLSVYATTKYLTDELKKYVTLNTDQTIGAHKNFLNGLSIGGLPITKSQDDVIYIDGNLAVRGGITMYADGGKLDLPSIYAGIPIDNQTIFWEETIAEDGSISRVLKAVGGTGGGGLTEVYWDDVIGRPTLLSSFINDKGFASTLGELVNVGSWADSAPTQGRFLYQEAGSSEWSYKNISEFISQTGAYLPLSGGSLEGSTGNILKITSTYVTTNGWHTPLSAYTPNMPSQAHANIEVGKSSSARNLAWFGFKYESDGSYNNLLTMGMHSVDDALVINGYGYVGVGTLSPTTALDIYDGDVTANAYRVGRWNNSKADNMTSQLDYTTSYLRTTPQLCGGNTLQHIIGWANTLNGASETRYTIGSWRAAEGYGKMIFNVMSSTNRLIELGLNGKTGYLQLTGSSEFGQYNQNMHHLFYGIGTGDGYYSVVELVAPNEVSISYGDNRRYSDPYRWSVGRVGVGSSAKFQFWNAVANTAVIQIFTSGDFLTTGGITMYSDIRKKTKLQDVELTLKQIADAPLIEHYYNSDTNKTTHVGSIAQYWAETIGNDWFCKLDSEGFYTMEIQNAALASAISVARELVKYESKTDKEIRLLKDEVKRLKKEIKILKSA